MKEVKYTYYLEGELVEKDQIDWDRASIIKVADDKVLVSYSTVVDRASTSLEVSMDEFLAMMGLKTNVKASSTTSEDLKKHQEEMEFEEELDRIWNLLYEDKLPEDFEGIPDNIETTEELKAFIDNLCKGDGKERLTIESSGKLSMGCDNPTAKLHVPGVKHNKFKAPLDIVQTRQFPKALQLVALATAFGNKKYEATDKDFLNFKRVSGGSQTYLDAAARHNTEREELDAESGLEHIVHVVWNNLAALELWIEENEIDIKDYSSEYLKNL